MHTCEPKEGQRDREAECQAGSTFNTEPKWDSIS